MTSPAYTAARERAAWLDRSNRGRIVASGADRRTYLHGLLTNDIASLAEGTGCYAAYLTAQGRMIADLWVYELGDVLLVATHGEVKDTVLARLDQFIFSEDVQLGDVTATFAAIAIVGPESAGVLERTLVRLKPDATDVTDVRLKPDATGVPDATGGSETLRALPEHGNRRCAFNETPAIVTRITDVGEPGYEVYVAAEQRDALIQALEAAGAVAMDADTAETIRVEAGVPLFHRDMDEETIPLEAGIEGRAISFSKGCYVGQEVIIRVLHRGHGRVSKRLVALVVDGDEIPRRGAVIESDGKLIGRVTSAVFSPRANRPIALGYVHRELAEPDTSVRISSSSAGGNGIELISARVTHRIS